MASILVIEKGTYSDLVGVYTTQKKAERVAEALNSAGSYDRATIAEWPLDPGFDAINKGRKPFAVTMLWDGEVERVSPSDISYCELADDYRIWERTKAPAYIGKGLPDALTATVWARNEKHAVKIANEHRAQMIANGEWR